MLSDILYLFIIIAFIATGIKHPFIALAGVIWVDTFKPQNISYSFLSGLPFSRIFTLIFFLSIFLQIKKIKIPDKKIGTFLIFFFIVWITITTNYAHFPELALKKWDYVFKGLITIFLIPFVLQKREHIDLFIVIFVSSVSYFTLTAGIKTILSGGGYGIVLIKSGEAGGLVESSSLSMVSVLCLPLIYYLYKFSPIYQRFPMYKALTITLLIVSTATVIGTYARTGLLSLFALVFFIVITSNRKMLAISILALCSIPALIMMPSSWSDRMNTVQTANTDQSALGRILVWRWVIDYVSERPFMGGGFLSYHANAGILNNYEEPGDATLAYHERGKAFHSMYFETLGEQGYVGLLTLLSIFGYAFLINRKTIKNKSSPEWKVGIAQSINACIFVFCVGGSFIGVAYQPWCYYLFGVSLSLYNIPNLTKEEKDQKCAIPNIT